MLRLWIIHNENIKLGTKLFIWALKIHCLGLHDQLQLGKGSKLGLGIQPSGRIIASYV